ncbi:MAG TPA: hypothetical protein ENI88_10045 [Desulfobulbus sp.]|nr:hypothetical protein [Desulfobulbus sp.]
MKKVLVAGAALLLVGGMVGSAMAEVNLSGDARVRWVVKDNYGGASGPFGKNFGNGGGYVDGQYVEQDTVNYFDSRIRVKVDAASKGGAWAKARIRMNDFKWDGQGYGAVDEKKNIWVDYAYIGVPVGPTTLIGGEVRWDVTTFFQWDVRPTVAALNYKNDNVDIYGLYIVEDDYPNAYDDLKDNNMRAYGIYAKANINADWSVLGYGLYNDDQRDYNSDLSSRNGNDNSGFLGTLHVDGNAAGLGITGEIAYVNSDVQGTENDGWGGYAEVSYAIGALTPALNIGFTKDSYVADGDFGWLMIGDIEPIAVLKNVGGVGEDWTWIAGTVDYAVSENLKLTGNLVWASVDTNDDTALNVNRLANLLEISGEAVYTVSEGANLTAAVGYLGPDFDGRADGISTVDGVNFNDDSAFGGMLQMEIKF